MIGPTSHENSLTFGGDLVPPLWNFRRFITIYHTVSSQSSRHTAKSLTPTR